MHLWPLVCSLPGMQMQCWRRDSHIVNIRGHKQQQGRLSGKTEGSQVSGSHHTNPGPPASRVLITREQKIFKRKSKLILHGSSFGDRAGIFCLEHPHAFQLRFPYLQLVLRSKWGEQKGENPKSRNEQVCYMYYLFETKQTHLQTIMKSTHVIFMVQLSGILRYKSSQMYR